MPDIVVRQSAAANITLQSNSTQLVLQTAAPNTVVLQTTSSSYVLPPATNTTLGGIIVGDNLTINANGLLSATAGAGVNSFNSRTGNVTLLANDVTSLANGVYLADTASTVNMSYGNDAVYGLRKTSGAVSFVAGKASLADFSVVLSQDGSSVASVEFQPDSVFGGVLLRHNNITVKLSPNGLTAYSGTANYSWSDDSFITQGRADGRYATHANLTFYQLTATNTWANLTGKPVLANIATTGSYADLTGTPNLSLYLTTANAAAIYLPQANFTYANISGTIPTATNTTLGAIKVGNTLEIANGVLNITVLTIDGGSATASGPDAYDGGGA